MFSFYFVETVVSNQPGHRKTLKYINKSIEAKWVGSSGPHEARHEKTRL